MSKFEKVSEWIMPEDFDWGSMAVLEESNAPPWYTLPEGWTWKGVAASRFRYGTNPRFFPLACAPGVTAWGRPLATDKRNPPFFF